MIIDVTNLESHSTSLKSIVRQELNYIRIAYYDVTLKFFNCITETTDAWKSKLCNKQM